MIWAWQASQIMCGVEGAAAAACGSTSGGGAPRPVRGGGGAAGGGGTTHCGETEQRWHTVQNGAMKPCSVRGSRSVIRTYAAPTHRTVRTLAHGCVSKVIFESANRTAERGSARRI